MLRRFDSLLRRLSRPASRLGLRAGLSPAARRRLAALDRLAGQKPRRGDGGADDGGIPHDFDGVLPSPRWRGPTRPIASVALEEPDDAPEAVVLVAR